jgi:hypothetical protein
MLDRFQVDSREYWRRVALNLLVLRWPRTVVELSVALGSPKSFEPGSAEFYERRHPFRSAQLRWFCHGSEWDPLRTSLQWWDYDHEI